MDRYRMFIDNEWQNPNSGEWFDTLEPFSGHAWAQIPSADEADVDRAVVAAHRALEGEWGAISASERGVLIYRLAQLIEENAEHLANIESRDNGKLISEVLGQVRYMAKCYFYYAGLSDKIQGSVIPIDKPKVFNYTRYEPMGVVVTITPWNSSLLLTAWKVAPALCAGNTVVAKPSEHTSASLFELAKLVKEAGFPAGVFNVVTGFGPEGASGSSAIP